MTTAQVFQFLYETATGFGDVETLDPVAITAETREAAAELFVAHVHAHGGRAVRCDSCTDAPLLVGEEVCADCVSFAKAIVLTPDMRDALIDMVDGSALAADMTGGADDCVLNDLATQGGNGYEINSLGRAAIAPVQS